MAPYGLAFSQNGSRFAVAGGAYGKGIENMRIWDQATGAELATLPTAGPVALSPNGRLIASGNTWIEPKVELWDIAQKKRLAILAKHDERVAKIAFSPDGTWLASASENTLQLSPVAE